VSRDPRAWLRPTLLLLALLLGTGLRVRGIGAMPIFGDENHTLLSADSSYGSILTTFDTVGSHVPLPLLQRLSLDLFGPGLVVFRLVALVPGLLTLLLAYPCLRAFVGRDAGVLATWLLAISPMHVYYSRFARGYALALLLALVLSWALLRLVEDPAPRRGSWIALVASAALLPWVHLSTLGFVLFLGLTGVGLAWRRERARARRLALAFVLAGALAFTLYLPVLGQVVSYFRVMESEPPPLDWFGVPTLIAGGRWAAVLWGLALALAAALSGRRRPAAVGLTAAALAGPLVLLLATSPRGMDYAWARYLLSALPLLAAGVAAAPFLLARRLPPGPGRGWVEPGVLLGGVALCLLQLRAGPLGPSSLTEGGFSNSYLALLRLPAFDEPFPGAPAFYRTLAADPAVTRIVEAPTINTRAVLLYRNYALIHGKRVLQGWTGEMPRAIRGPMYSRLLDLGPEDADYLVLHRDQLAEAVAYFEFVYQEAWPRLRFPGDETFMKRQESIYGQNLVGPELTDPIAARLREQFGEPCYEDGRLRVWKLGP